MASTLRIDIHTHILPEHWPDLKARYGYGGFAQLEQLGPGCARMVIDGRPFRDVAGNCWDPRLRLEECDRDGVDVQVLSTVPVMFNYWAKPAHTHDLSQLLNDHIAGVVADAPARFIGLGTLPMQDCDLAVKELERCVGQLGLAGIEIGTHISGWNLDDDRIFPIFEAAEALGAAVFVHPWAMLGRQRMSLYWLPWLVGMPTETALSICSMIFGGVFERLPRLRVSFAHGGGTFPGILGRVAHGFRVRPDLVAVRNPRDPLEYIGRFFVDSLVQDARTLRFMIEMLGAESIALGSDYPFPLGEHPPGKIIDSLTLDEATRVRLSSGTALEWLGLDAAPFQAEGPHASRRV